MCICFSFGMRGSSPYVHGVAMVRSLVPNSVSFIGLFCKRDIELIDPTN